MEEKKYLKWYNKIGYGSGDIAGNVVYAFLTSFVMVYLTDTIGLASGIVGTLIAVSKLLDGFTDIFFGSMIDKTHSKMGKARPWMLYGYIGCAITLVACFAVPTSLGRTAQYAWFFIAYTLLNGVFYTANNIAYSALTSLVTKNSKERVQMGSYRFIFAFSTSLLIQAVTVGFVAKCGGDAAAWRMVAIIYAVIGLVVNTISALSVKELPEEELNEGDTTGEEEKYGLVQAFKLLVKNKFYLMICGTYILQQLYSAMIGAGIYYMTWVLKNKNLFGQFAWAVNIPLIIALIFRVKPAKAFLSALYAGVSLEGFSLIIGAYTPIITPLVQNMSKVMSNVTGVELNTFDVGWQATSVVAFATSAGMIYLGLGIALQTVLFLVKWTNIFQPSDLWNNYSYIVWGAMVIFKTHNFALGIACMILLNLYSLLISELVAKRWSKYYNYPNCTIIAMHNVEPAIFAIVIDPILNLLGLNKVKLNPKSIEKKLGFIGEPMTLGFILGGIIGILGNVGKLTSMAGWGSVFTAAIATAAIMAIFPKIASMFAQAFAPITEAARVFMKNSGDREWYIAVNDAVGYGEPATLTSGLLLIPIMVVIATVLPGNQVLPVVDLLAIPYMVQGLVAVYKGNMSKILVAGVIWFSLGLLMCTYTAPLFTDVARGAGFAIPAGAAMITSFNILGKPMLGFVFLAFLSGNPLFIGIAVAVYAVAFFIFKTKNAQIVAYLDRQADKNDAANEAEGA